MSSFNSTDIEDEGFVPLKKPVSFSQARMERTISFNTETGEKEDLKSMWEGSSKLKNRGMSRGNSFVGSKSAPSLDEEEKGAIVIVDPFSTGAHLAAAVCAQGLKCVRVFSIWDSPVASLIQHGVAAEFCATLQYNDTLEDEDAATNEVVAAIRALPFPVLAVIPGAETGVEIADRLSARLGLRSNGEVGSLARRNKYLMGEAVRAAGVRAVKQALCHTLDDLHDFLLDLAGGGVVSEESGVESGVESGDATTATTTTPTTTPTTTTTTTTRRRVLTPNQILKCVVKPVQSAGTDDVFLCSSAEEAIVAFKRILGKRNGIGLINDAVLAQEFLDGKEYVIDKVSRDGVHKVVAIWEYDKRSVNNANFVYFGMRLMSSQTEQSQQLIAYADGVLDALGIAQGPSHMEVMYCKDNGYNNGGGPCLVEVGSRCHGGEGSWLPVAMECIGYTVVNVTLDAYLTGELFNSIDKDTFPKLKAGREVDMVCRHGGVVRCMPGDVVIRNLASFRSINWEIKPGDFSPVTIDCFTRPGSVQLVNESEVQAECDLEAIHDLEDLGLLDYSVMCPVPPAIGTVVVVDPIDAGAQLAASVIEWGYRLCIIFTTPSTTSSSTTASSTTILHKGTHLVPTLIIHHDSLTLTLATITSHAATTSSPVLAILAGDETGSELAERLAIAFGTRHNGPTLLSARHDSNEMSRVLSQASIPHSLTHHDNTNNNNTNNNDDTTTADFAVDGVSRDGVYKAVAVWQLDHRHVNHSQHRICTGMTLLTPQDTLTGFSELISLASHTATSLGLRNGPSHTGIALINNTLTITSFAPHSHPGDGHHTHLTSECITYTQIDTTLAAYLQPNTFDSIPAVYTHCGSSGRAAECFLISKLSGRVVSMPGLTRLRELTSCRRVEMHAQPGSHIDATSDINSRVGSVLFVSPTRLDLAADINTVRELEEMNELFVLA